MDVTDTEGMRRTLELTRPVVAILMVDNYEDLMKATPEGQALCGAGHAGGKAEPVVRRQLRG